MKNKLTVYAVTLAAVLVLAFVVAHAAVKPLPHESPSLVAQSAGTQEPITLTYHVPYGVLVMVIAEAPAGVPYCNNGADAPSNMPCYHQIKLVATDTGGLQGEASQYWYLTRDPAACARLGLQLPNGKCRKK